MMEGSLADWPRADLSLPPPSLSTWYTVWGLRSPGTLNGEGPHWWVLSAAPTSFQKAGGMGDPVARPGFGSGCRHS